MANKKYDFTTWNPVSGCTKISAGCKHCFAERIALRLHRDGQPKYANGFGLTIHEYLLNRPLAWRKPRRVFVNSMSDIFHKDVPLEFIRKMFDVMNRAWWHHFTILTKRAEADYLIELEKHAVDDQPWRIPAGGENIRVPLLSNDGREKFYLDLGRGRIDLKKGKYQTRARQVVIFVRLDFGESTSESTHENPDGERIRTPHLHIYKEGYADKWAYPVSLEQFPNINSDLAPILRDFAAYCNITQPPHIEGRLF